MSQEIEPQKELLRQKRAKLLLTQEEFQAALEKLTQEETERQQDIEIEFADKEKEVREELERLKIESEQEQKKLLKDRQTRERLAMFGELMNSLDEKD